MTFAPGLSGRPQAGSMAIQHVGNLRYDFVHGPNNPNGGCYEIQNTKCQKPGDFADFQRSGLGFLQI